MVDLTKRVQEITKLVDAGKYFVINRARQYGKTTTLTALYDHLIGRYVVISTSFEGIGNAGFAEVCGPLVDRFKEKNGREQFLLYLKPIINGTGNYYIESQTRDQTRTDVIVDYLGQQYIIELKIWRGERYNEEGERQISEYLDYFHLNTGYMLSFNFNKKKELAKRIGGVKS